MNILNYEMFCHKYNLGNLFLGRTSYLHSRKKVIMYYNSHVEMKKEDTDRNNEMHLNTK